MKLPSELWSFTSIPLIPLGQVPPRPVGCWVRGNEVKLPSELWSFTSNPLIPLGGVPPLNKTPLILPRNFHVLDSTITCIGWHFCIHKVSIMPHYISQPTFRQKCCLRIKSRCISSCQFLPKCIIVVYAWLNHLPNIKVLC